MKNIKYDYLSEFHFWIGDLDYPEFIDMNNYLVNKNKGIKKMSQQQKDMLEESKKERQWEKQQSK